MPLHLLDLDFDSVQGFREHLSLLYDGCSHAVARIRIRQRRSALVELAVGVVSRSPIK
jgi:hypothetical protein